MRWSVGQLLWLSRRPELVKLRLMLQRSDIGLAEAQVVCVSRAAMKGLPPPPGQSSNTLQEKHSFCTARMVNGEWSELAKHSLLYCKGYNKDLSDSASNVANTSLTQKQDWS